MRKHIAIAVLLLGVLAAPVRADIPPTTLSPIINAPVATMPPDGVYIGMSGYSIIDYIFLAFFG